MAYEVPATTIHFVLLALKESSGAHYEKLLTAAGLTRFLLRLPPDSWELVAERNELTQLFTAVYNTLGEALTRTFLRNWGQFTAHKFAANPLVAELRAEAQALPPEQQLAWFVQTMAAFSARSWAPHIISEDDRAWYCEMDPCPVCRDIRGAHGPICGDCEGMYSAMAKHLLGHRVVIEEVACAAAGAARCKWAYYK